MNVHRSINLIHFYLKKMSTGEPEVEEKLHGCYRDAKFWECGDDNSRGRFVKITIPLSRSLWGLIYANCLRSSEKAFNLTEILSAAVAYNGRITINGVDIKSRGKRLDTNDLLHVVVAAYCISYSDRSSIDSVLGKLLRLLRVKRRVTVQTVYPSSPSCRTPPSWLSP